MSQSPSSWYRGRLDSRKGPRQVLFGRMYEDASIELEAFAPGSRIMCIASAGCTAMKLAPHHEVVAVDINPIQLEYAEERFHGSPGFRGRAERIMDKMRVLGPLAGWWPSRVQAFLALDDPEKQMVYWSRKLNTWRFRSTVDLLLSTVALRAAYSRHLLDFLPEHLGAVMRGRMERCFSLHSNRTNPYAHALLNGEMSTNAPPCEACDIQLVHSEAADYLEKQPPGSFDGFTLSNILDGADDQYRQRLLAAVKRASSPEAVAILRSFKTHKDISVRNRAPDDRSMLWGTVLVENVATF